MRPASILAVFALRAATALAEPNVVLRDDPGATFDCAIGDCLAAYRSFPERHAAQARPRPPAVVDGELAAADALPFPAPLPLGSGELRAAVREATGVGFLFDGLDARPLVVSTIATTDAAAWAERRVVFTDPEVGEFDALVLEPAAGDRLPAIIGLHGHLDTPDAFAERYLGRTLAAAGYLVVMPRLRAMDCLGTFGPELEISRTLLASGFTLIGLRAYETALVGKYLRALARVDADRIGVLSHSGGSSTAALAVWLADDVAAHVSDYRQDWRNRCGVFESLHCETVPALFPLAATLADDARAPMPRRTVDYGYPAADTRAGIGAFFDETLRGPYCPRLDRAACDGDALPARLARRAHAACERVALARQRTGRRRAAALDRARALWRSLAVRVAAMPAPATCRTALRAALRRAARQRDAAAAGS